MQVCQLWHFIKMRRLMWPGHGQRMGDARKKNIYQADLCHELPKGKPKAMQKHDVNKDIRKMGTVNWRQIEQDRDVWTAHTILCG